MEQEINIDLGRTKKVDITVDCHISLLTIITMVETKIKNQKLKMNKVKTIVLNTLSSFYKELPIKNTFVNRSFFSK